MLESLALPPGVREALLPTPEQTLLLRACLQQGEPARLAWAAWRGGEPSVEQRLANGRRGARRLLPMLYRSAQRNDLPLEPALLTYLRTATMYEGLRARAYRRVCRSALAALAEGRVAAVMLKGPALAAAVYERWSLRHCHDLDLLVNEADAPRAASSLASSGFARTNLRPEGGSAGRRLVHGSGLPAALHTRLFEIAYYQPPLAEMWERSRLITIAGEPARILSAPDTLVHVCGHAACSRSRETLQWACDAWVLIERVPDLDWSALAAGALAGRLAMPVAIMLDYLSATLGAPVPEGVLLRLAAAAAGDSSGRDAVLAGARAGSRGTLSALLRATPGLGARVRLLLWTAFPSAEYVRLSQPGRRRGQLIGYYARRGLGYLARRLRSLFGRRRPRLYGS